MVIILSQMDTDNSVLAGVRACPTERKGFLWHKAWILKGIEGNTYSQRNPTTRQKRKPNNQKNKPHTTLSDEHQFPQMMVSSQSMVPGTTLLGDKTASPVPNSGGQKQEHLSVTNACEVCTIGDRAWTVTLWQFFILHHKIFHFFEIWIAFCSLQSVPIVWQSCLLLIWVNIVYLCVVVICILFESSFWHVDKPLEVQFVWDLTVFCQWDSFTSKCPDAIVPNVACLLGASRISLFANWIFDNCSCLLSLLFLVFLLMSHCSELLLFALAHEQFGNSLNIDQCKLKFCEPLLLISPVCSFHSFCSWAIALCCSPLLTKKLKMKKQLFPVAPDATKHFANNNLSLKQSRKTKVVAFILVV